MEITTSVQQQHQNHCACVIINKIEWTTKLRYYIFKKTYLKMFHFYFSRHSYTTDTTRTVFSWWFFYCILFISFNFYLSCVFSCAHSVLSSVPFWSSVSFSPPRPCCVLIHIIFRTAESVFMIEQLSSHLRCSDSHPKIKIIVNSSLFLFLINIFSPGRSLLFFIVTLYLENGTHAIWLDTI